MLITWMSGIAATSSQVTALRQSIQDTTLIVEAEIFPCMLLSNLTPRVL